MHLIDWLVLALSAALAWLASGLGRTWFGRLLTVFGALGRRPGLAIAAVGAATVAARIALLPWFPVPEPSVHDEFSYLLAADTFAHGRLANPAHPMAAYFETFHVLQHPTYASIYPPAQGAVLAAGKLVGNPWTGVLLSTAAMCMAITWALQGWVQAEWALLGGALAWSRFAIFTYWMNSYWGGAAAATGGALVIGALPRIFQRRRPRDAVVFGIGAGILANSRPLEGAIFCLPVGLAVLWWWVRSEPNERRVRLRRVILPLAAVLAIALGFEGYYNTRVTGSPTSFPERMELREKFPTPLFVWEPTKPPQSYPNEQFEDFFNENVPGEVVPASLKLYRLWFFFAGPAFSVALLALPWLLRDRRVRLLVLQVVLSIVGLCAVTFFLPHYAAPLTATLMVLVTLGFVWLSRARLKGVAVGQMVVATAVLYTVAIGPVYFATEAWPSRLHATAQEPFRRPTERQLEAQPGNHLVLVSYGDGHDPGEEYVYNAADVDHARIVWARLVPGQNLAPLLSYFRNRDVWVFKPDDGTLERYVPSTDDP